MGRILDLGDGYLILGLINPKKLRGKLLFKRGKELAKITHGPKSNLD